MPSMGGPPIPPNPNGMPPPWMQPPPPPMAQGPGPHGHPMGRSLELIAQDKEDKQCMGSSSQTAHQIKEIQLISGGLVVILVIWELE